MGFDISRLKDKIELINKDIDKFKEAKEVKELDALFPEQDLTNRSSDAESTFYTELTDSDLKKCFLKLGL